MIRLWQRRLLAAMTAALLLATAACSSGGGRQEEQVATGGGGEAATTPRLTIAMVTAAPPGDAFWDIIQKGARAAAAKDNVEFLYSGDTNASRQAQLVQAAIDQQVDGLIVTLHYPDALADVVGNAVAAGIPVVAMNAGQEAAFQLGLLGYIGQDENVAGEAAGQALNELGVKKAICIIQVQGAVNLEQRCAGAARTFAGQMENLFAEGTNLPLFQSTVGAKLQTEKDIDAALTLSAPLALVAVAAVQEAGSAAKVATFDMNTELIKALQDGTVEFTVDQQPYLQGYLAVDSLWLYETNGNVIGGGRPVLTGPTIITKETAERIAEFADQGTR
jgi:simple sugar transport system substrate-binding protein